MKVLLNRVFQQYKGSRKRNEKLLYIFLNIFTTLIRFCKGLVFMRFLTLKELGMMTILTSIMTLFSLLQIGLLNGGYRIFSADNQEKWKVNDIIYTYFLTLWGILLAGILIAFLLRIIDQKEAIFALLGTFFGILALFNSWNRNLLVAERKFSRINTYEIVSTLVAFSFLALVPHYRIYAALVVLFTVEFIFYLMTIMGNKQYLPKRLTLSLNQLVWILSFGFIPFLASMVTLLSNQVQTWCIAGFLSTEDLGSYYLPSLYISLFLLIPNSVDKIYFPVVMKEFVSGNFTRVRNIIRKYMIINASVALTAIILSLLFMKIVVGYLVPKHLVGIPYVWILLPGIVTYTLFQPYRLIFNAAVKQTPFLWASGIALVFTSSFLITIGLTGNLTLSVTAWVKSISYALIGLVVYIIYILNRKTIWKVKIS